ncbi:DUF2076 domain-containing protein [Falsirhodobacter deserti]|uniref:DUF2076 domain-containing protein n=1 Tax=Falsirhodobacter deserti TaxID=1365611 RepID=UPI000FE414DF|nr:DUF2076 domain-containing protein [Falsirhodobacter deserti]
MNEGDRQAITILFNKLAMVERQGPQRDDGAEAYIRSAIAQQPAAPYYLAQTVIVQEKALEAAQKRIEELEAKSSPQKTDRFLSRFLGGPSVPNVSRRSPRPAAAQGGGFLAGAAQTAMGVAGGVLLGNMIGGMFAGDAAASTPEDEEPLTDESADQDDGFDDGGFEE